jgi:putative tryptophan/tyrosine transport system substrate-binding protein
MRRREFFTLAGAAIMWPLASAGQPKPMPVIGILDPDVSFIFDAFVEGMRDLGYFEGRNIAYVRKLVPAGSSIPSLVAELVDLKVDVIVTVSVALIDAARRATTSIPIVSLVTGDPVSAGQVDSLGHPGGNVTGLSMLNDDLSVKRVELLLEMVPNLKDISVFRYFEYYEGGSWRATEQAAQRLGLRLHPAQLRALDSFEPAFQEAAAAHVEAVDVMSAPFFYANRERLVQLAAKYRLPAIYDSADFVRSGGLMSDGVVFTDMGRRGASFVDKILKGANPGDLPIEQPTKFELAINLKAADALGLNLPPTLLARADVLIE